MKAGIYPIVRRKLNLPEVDHTDGIGTKGFYHWKAGTFKEAIIDALAMNLNDLALINAVPYKISNHITVPVEDERVVKILKALVKECKKRQIAITGGENSFHDNMEGMDLSITMTGFVKSMRGNTLKTGDVIIGLKSSGLHSNGFTTVRKIFGDKIQKEFTKPTAIYLYDILKVSEKVDIHGMMHITGGAFTKLKDIAQGVDVVISNRHDLKPQKIFKQIYERGLSDGEMYRTFNCGIGFVLSVAKRDVDAVLKTIKQSEVIGEVKRGNGKIRVLSSFSKKIVEY